MSMTIYLFRIIADKLFRFLPKCILKFLRPALCLSSSKLTKQKHIIMKTQNLHRQKASFIIHLIERDDGNKKKQGLETIPTRPCV